MVKNKLTITRALRQCLNEGRRDNVPAIRIAWIEARKEIAHGNAVISDCRDRLKRMGEDRVRHMIAMDPMLNIFVGSFQIEVRP